MNLNRSWIPLGKKWLLIQGSVIHIYFVLKVVFAGSVLKVVTGVFVLFNFIFTASIMLCQAQLYTILELCRAFDRVFKEHLDGGWVINYLSSS